MRRDDERLQDILDSIEKIEKYSVQGEEAFLKDERSQVWFLHYLQIIGEAMSKLPRNLRDQHPEVAWNRFLIMRNALVHDYFNLTLNILWDTVDKELTGLKAQVEAILRDLTGEKG